MPARLHKVTRGQSSSAAVPIRQLIVESARRHVVRVTILGEGMSMEPANLEDEDVIEAVEAAVGYVAVPR